jgi:hypothetical protein
MLDSRFTACFEGSSLLVHDSESTKNVYRNFGAKFCLKIQDVNCWEQLLHVEVAWFE